MRFRLLAVAGWLLVQACGTPVERTSMIAEEDPPFTAADVRMASNGRDAGPAADRESARAGDGDADREANGGTVLAVDDGHLPGLCRRPGDDLVRDVFCDPNRPQVDSLAALQVQLRLTEDGVTPSLDRVPFVMLGLSTALSGRLVSPINPRLLLLGPVFMAFQRGVQKVELIAQNRRNGRLVFYLVEFEQDCNDERQGCRPGHLYTMALERGWRRVTLRDDEDLKNTAEDCRQCHQRGRQKPTLLMRELEAPWTHFFAPASQPPGSEAGVTGGDLSRDYLAAKGDEPLAGVSSQLLVSATAGFFLEAAVPTLQPVLFDSPRIADERFPHATQGPLRSPTWDRAFDAFQRGEQLALPHYATRPTDPDKQSALTKAYAAYRAGEMAVSELPDLGDIFPDDPMVRAEIGLQTVPGATPAQVLIQACGGCHNDVLDQRVSRARFNIDLTRMSEEELQRAVARLRRAEGEPGVMPPPQARQLLAPVRAALIDYLSGGRWAPQELRSLAAAARAGMAFGEGSSVMFTGATAGGYAIAASDVDAGLPGPIVY